MKTIRASMFTASRLKKRSHEVAVLDVVKVADPAHPRRYREICSRRELARRREIKLKDQEGLCAVCWKPVLREPSTDHIRPKGMNGALRDDHIDNLQAAHCFCNGRKGSRRRMELPMIGPYLLRLKSRECLCGLEKDEGRPFCPACIERLSGESKLRLGLVPSDLKDPRAILHAQACEDAEKELLQKLCHPGGQL